MTNWNDPASRLTLIECVGPEQYAKMHAEHRANTVIATYGGHEIRPVQTRFGRLYQVGNTKFAFSTMAQAICFASDHPTKSDE